MRLRNDTYIKDGILYLNYVLDGTGAHIRLSKLWEKWNYKHPNANPPVTKVQSFDGGYVTNNITDLRVAGDQDLLFVTTASNRKVYMTPESTMLTADGYVPARQLGIGQQLVTMDNYKGYYGDHIKLGTSGNQRAQAILRNHGVPFEVLPNGGCRVDGFEIHVVDYGTGLPWPTVTEYSYTYGLNNYRDGIHSLFGLTNSFVDAIVRIVPGTRRYTVGIYVDGPQNVVLTNGLVIGSTQTEVRT